jgi:hypothetical protein
MILNAFRHLQLELQNKKPFIALEKTLLISVILRQKNQS